MLYIWFKIIILGGLHFYQWLISIGFGSITLVVNQILKFIDEDKLFFFIKVYYLHIRINLKNNSLFNHQDKAEYYSPSGNPRGHISSLEKYKMSKDIQNYYKKNKINDTKLIFLFIFIHKSSPSNDFSMFFKEFFINPERSFESINLDFIIIAFIKSYSLFNFT